jgi:CRISPR type I-E-associated protein CasB/Cse2
VWPTHPDEADRLRARPLSSVVGAIGTYLGAEWFPGTQRAQLKRYRRQHGGPAEFVALRVLIASGCPAAGMNPAELSTWIWLVHCMALLSNPGQAPHSTLKEAHPGRLLQKAGYNSFRLSRLLEAREERFQTLFERAIRRIAALGEPLNWAKLTPLILPNDPESVWPEHARLEIARDFAIAEARSQALGQNRDPASSEQFSTGYDPDD